MKMILAGMLACASWLALAAPAGLAHAQALAEQRDTVNTGTVGIMTGRVAGTSIQLGSDLAILLDDGYVLRVLPIVGKGDVRSFEDLLLLKGVDIAIVQADVLDFYQRSQVFPGIDLSERVQYITRMADEEVHVLSRDTIASVDDLAGRKVNFGPSRSGTFMTASVVFDALGVEVETTSEDQQVALDQLKRGEIDAMVIVSGAPTGEIKEQGAESGLHLLPVDPVRVGGSYLAAELSDQDYPTMIAAGSSVPTVSVPSVMAVYNWNDGHPRRQKVTKFVELFFANFAALQEEPFHKKWRKVDLGAEVPGWQRFEAARQLASHNN